MDPDPAIFVNDLQDVNKSFLCLFHLEGTFTSFFKDKVIQKSQNSGNQCFSNYFCLMIEGSGSESLTDGYESGRAQKHMDPTDPDPQHCMAACHYYEQ
jgi:hypothetical protein